MGAFKNFCIEVAESGNCLVGDETLGYLDDLECQRGIDWIGYTEFDFTDMDGTLHTEECIDIESARRLVAEGIANDEIKNFMEHFGWLAPATPGHCPRCGSDNVTFMVAATFFHGRLTVVNADEPEGPTVHGNAHCEECGDVCDATFPEWTYAMRDDALAAYASPVLREALIQLHRAAVSAGLSAPAVDLAAAALRGIGYEVARGRMYYQP